MWFSYIQLEISDLNQLILRLVSSYIQHENTNKNWDIKFKSMQNEPCDPHTFKLKNRVYKPSKMYDSQKLNFNKL